MRYKGDSFLYTSSLGYMSQHSINDLVKPTSFEGQFVFLRHHIVIQRPDRNTLFPVHLSGGVLRGGGGGFVNVVGKWVAFFHWYRLFFPLRFFVAERSRKIPILINSILSYVENALHSVNQISIGKTPWHILSLHYISSVKFRILHYRWNMNENNIDS